MPQPVSMQPWAAGPFGAAGDSSGRRPRRSLDGPASLRARNGRRGRQPLPSCLILALLAGCGPRTTEFHVTDYRPDGSAQRYFEAFDECYYCTGPGGTVEIVARRRAPRAGGEAGPVTQVVHLRQVWAAVPGRTPVERTMINATVSYLIAGPAGGAAFDGGGFFTFTEKRGGREIRGRLESSTLRPRQTTDNGGELYEPRTSVRADALFSRAAVTGTFRAVRDERRARRIVHEMERVFGPVPPYQPPAVTPDVR